MFGGKDFEDLK